MSDLNPHLIKRYGSLYVSGFLAAAQLADVMFSYDSKYSRGDQLLAKVNLLKPGLRVRRRRQ